MHTDADVSSKGLAPATAQPSAPLSSCARTGTDGLGCQASKLHHDQQLVASGITYYRKRSDDPKLGRVATSGTDRGFLVGVSRSDGHRRRIFHTHHSSVHDFDAGSVYVRDFGDDYRADLGGSFDFLLLEVSHAALDRARHEAGGRRPSGLATVAGHADPTLAGLVGAMLPALARPAEANELFVSQLSATIGTYLVERYGRDGPGADGPEKRRKLSRTLEARAKDMLLASLAGDISVADIADACQLSRSYFITAFRETTGETPHQWLVARRVERARELLAHSNVPLADVAAHCGFADQSHFTRVFSLAVGTPPGVWRRSARA